MPVALLDKALDIARRVRAFLYGKSGQSTSTESERRKSYLVREIEIKKRALGLIKEKMHTAANPKARRLHNIRRRRARHEIAQLRRELKAAKGEVEVGRDTNPMPDFVIIGAQKGGTTFLYHLLIQHPLVKPAVRKEVHFFDRHFEKGIEWYRQSFPDPKWKGGRKIITGEASPSYLIHPLVAERMAETVPQARLIVILRNPVDRAFSHYQMQVKRGQEPRAFEEVVEAELTRLRAEGNETAEGTSHDGFEQQMKLLYLSRGVYVDQLLRWRKFFSTEQMLVLSSEGLFERPVETLKVVLDFLDLPGWEPEASELRKKRHKGDYEQEMDPSTRRRLEEFFEPHNGRLYGYLGVDFGW